MRFWWPGSRTPILLMSLRGRKERGRVRGPEQGRGLAAQGQEGSCRREAGRGSMEDEEGPRGPVGVRELQSGKPEGSTSQTLAQMATRRRS